MKLLLLAGSGEARRLAQHFSTMEGLDPVASLAGTTREPLDLEIPTRVGGFGGRVGFEAFLEAEEIAAVLDATHPFAGRISRRTADVCRNRKLPYLQVLRPEWVPQSGDNWIFIDNESEAVDYIPKGATVFLGTGRQTLMRYANLAGRTLICRRIDTPRHAFPFENGEYLVGRPPFSVEQEVELFTRRKIDWLVVKNAGGELSRTKLEAARRLGLPVLMINRPPPPAGAKRVASVKAALQWVEDLL